MNLFKKLLFVAVIAQASFALASSLDNTSVKLPAKILSLPEGDLVLLSQDGEGSDDFGFFEEGLNLDEGNLLSVSNENGSLSVGVAGGHWTDGEEDSYNEASVVALEFSKSSQRYLVTNKYKGKVLYQILINVDRAKKLARVHMRMSEKGIMSEWSSIVDYKAKASTAGGAKINAKDEINMEVVIALDAENTPRVDGNMKSYPSIKGFREDSDFYEFCIEGNEREAKELLTELVAAADGDGDSWANLDSLTVIKSKTTGKPASYKLVVTITDESGENEESFSFPVCK